MAEPITRERFLEEGKKEFLEKGFKEASLRQICKNLGLTLGAFYGYFKSKEDLFETIVAEPAKEMFDYYIECHKNFFAKEPDIQREQLSDASNEGLGHMLSLMYGNYDAFKLVFCCSAGTKFEHYLEEFIQVEVEGTEQFLDIMRKKGFFKTDIDEQLSHILASMLFQGIIEIFEHDMTYEYAVKYVHKLELFYTAGWMKLFES